MITFRTVSGKESDQWMNWMLIWLSRRTPACLQSRRLPAGSAVLQCWQRCHYWASFLDQRYFLFTCFFVMLTVFYPTQPMLIKQSATWSHAALGLFLFPPDVCNLMPWEMTAALIPYRHFSGNAKGCYCIRSSVFSLPWVGYCELMSLAVF